MNLQQGDMSVKECMSKFHSLECFCSGIYLIKYSWAMKYARGLHNLWDQVITRGPNTLADASVAACELQYEYELTHQLNSSHRIGQLFQKKRFNNHGPSRQFKVPPNKHRNIDHRIHNKQSHHGLQWGQHHYPLQPPAIVQVPHGNTLSSRYWHLSSLWLGWTLYHRLFS